MKIYALINGAFYILYGLFGLFAPASMAAAMGWTPDLLGLHEVRGIWAGLAGIGVVCVMVALSGQLRSLVKAIVFLTLCFMVGRVVGLVLDGMGPQLTYMEIGFEIFWSGIGLILLKRNKA